MSIYSVTNVSCTFSCLITKHGILGMEVSWDCIDKKISDSLYNLFVWGDSLIHFQNGNHLKRKLKGYHCKWWEEFINRMKWLQEMHIFWKIPGCIYVTGHMVDIHPWKKLYTKEGNFHHFLKFPIILKNTEWNFPLWDDFFSRVSRVFLSLSLKVNSHKMRIS